MHILQNFKPFSGETGVLQGEQHSCVTWIKLQLPYALVYTKQLGDEEASMIHSHILSLPVEKHNGFSIACKTCCTACNVLNKY